MNHFIFSALLTFFSSIFAGFYFLTKKDSRLKLYIIYWFVIAFWSSTVAFQHYFLKSLTPNVWGWMLHLGCLFVPVLFIHFAVAYSDAPAPAKFIVKSSYVITAIYLFLNTCTTFFTFQTAYRDDYAYPVPSNFYFLYFISFITMVIYGTYLLMKLRLKECKQGKIYFISFLLLHTLAYVGALDNFFIMADIRIFPWYPYGLYLVVPYATIGSVVFYRSHATL